MFNPSVHISHGAYIEPKKKARGGLDLLSLFRIVRRMQTEPASKRIFLECSVEARKKYRHLTTEIMGAEIHQLVTVIQGQKQQRIGELYGAISACAETLSGERFNTEHDLSAWTLIQGGACERTSKFDLQIIATVCCTLALQGRCLHVVCSDDRSAKQAYNSALPLISALNISVGFIDRRLSSAKRILVYEKKIVFSAASEIIMDHLRDQVLTGGSVNETRSLFGSLAGRYVTGYHKTTRGLSHAIVLDGQNLLFDAALTSIMVNEKTENSADNHLPFEALGLAWQLLPEKDFEFHDQSYRLTRQGLRRVSIMTRSMGDRWARPARSEFMIIRALEVLYFWKNGRDYSIEGEELKALNADLEDRLQRDTESPTIAQFLAAREGHSSAVAGKAASRITFRQFFKRYSKMSAYVQDVKLYRTELLEAYGISAAGRSEADFIRRNILQVCFSEKIFLDKLSALRKGPRSPVHIIEAKSEEEANSLATSLNRRLWGDNLNIHASEFDPSHHCIWMSDVERLPEILLRSGNLPTDNPLIFVSQGIDTGHFISVLSSEWRYSWLVRLSASDFDGKWNSWFFHHLIRYVNSGFMAADVAGRWMYRHALIRNANETRKLRDTLVKLDQQYRKMISFAGPGN